MSANPWDVVQTRTDGIGSRRLAAALGTALMAVLLLTGCVARRVPQAPSPEAAKRYAEPSPFERIPRSEWIAESRNAFVIRDAAPKAPVHLLVVPKQHIPTLLQASPGLLGEMMELVKTAARQEGIADSGFRTIINTHPDSRQSVYHLHIHVLGGRKMDWMDGFAAPPSK